MKQIFLTIVALCMICQTIQAQQKVADTNSLTLGRQRQQDYVQTGREMKAETKNVDCIGKASYIQEIINVYDTTKSNDIKQVFMIKIARMSCPEVISFFERVISTDTSELIRCNAIMYLGWIDAQSSIPFLLARVNNQTISNYEKANIGTTFAVLENWRNAEPILNRYCFNLEKRFCQTCLWAYYMLVSRQ